MILNDRQIIELAERGMITPFRRESVRVWPGKKVVCAYLERESSPTMRRLLEAGKEYIVRSVSVGNYDAFVRLEGFPETVYSEYSRQHVPVSFNAEAFRLAREESR